MGWPSFPGVPESKVSSFPKRLEWFNLNITLIRLKITHLPGIYLPIFICRSRHAKRPPNYVIRLSYNEMFQ